MSRSAETERRSARPLLWNAGSWFGSQVGGTCWMLLASIVLMSASWRLSFALLALFIAINGLGWVLWSQQRNALSAKSGYSTLVVLIGVVNLAALFAIETTGNWSKIEVGGSLSPAAAMAFVVGAVCFTLVQITRLSSGSTDAEG